MQLIDDNYLDLERAYGQLLMCINRQEHQKPQRRDEIKKEAQTILTRSKRLLDKAKNTFEQEIIRELITQSKEHIFKQL